ncbi:MAG TPA: transposase [Gaiellaceae bacterium]|nr:transposase [Gaiellaceae bacterium]
MPRRPRAFYPGVPTHITAHGVDDQPIFLVEIDRFAFLALLRTVTERVGWHVVAWCLLDTHYHLLVVVAPAEPRVSWGMQMLNSVYAREFNRRHRRRGHVFGERFTDTLVASDAHLEAAVAYVLSNPVTAGLVREIDAWRWSGEHRLEPRPQPAQRSRNVNSSATTRIRPTTVSAVPIVPPTMTPTPRRIPAIR